MKNKGNIITLLICLFVLISISLKAQFTETRAFEKRFAIEKNTRIEITNKYGLIDVNTWDKDSIYLKINIKAEEKKLFKLEKTLEGMDFDFTNTPHYFIARTIVGDNQNQFARELEKFKETLLQTDGNVTIDYQVWLPDNHELKLENKFGDILIGDYRGDVDISISNGKLRAKDLMGKFSLNLNFADATVSAINNASITSNYSDAYIKQSKQVKLNSKSSNVEILQSSSLIIESRRDKYRIRLTDEIEADGNFSNFRISNLSKMAKLRTSYGDIEFENINNEFENIYLEAKSTGINLHFDEKANFKFEITETKTNLDLGREVKIIDTIELDEKDKKNLHNATFGENAKGDERLIINSVGGEIYISSF